VEAAKETARADIVVERVFDAPIDLVFDAWTMPEHLLAWWAPKGCSTPGCTVDLRPGGTFHFCIRTPDGNDIWALGRYREIVRPRRIVYVDSFADAAGNKVEPSYYGMSIGHPSETLVTVTFSDLGGRTRVVLRHALPAVFPERTGAEQGWGEMVDRLAEHLAAAGRSLVASRLFDAPRQLVFKAWTDPERISRWWGPRGFATTTEKMEVKPGGLWLHVMHGPDGRDYPNRIVYDRVVEPELIVYSHDAGEPGGPDEFQATVMFTPEGTKTRLTMRMVFRSRADRDRVVREYGADKGLQDTLTRLGEALTPVPR
jgi:uncharacterized protein YndB with AHSA1/START domain